MRVFRIQASYARDGQIIDCTQPEVVGRAYGRLYTERWEAESDADDLAEELAQASIDESTSDDIDLSTTYSVVEDSIAIRSVEIHDDDATDQIPSVHARIGVGGTVIDSVWFVARHHTGAGIDGWEPAGDCWMDESVVSAYGTDLAREIGREVIAILALGIAR